MNDINVLIVEDQSRMRNLIKIYLNKENYKVDEAKDGKIAIKKDYNKYDLILLDVMLPFVDGWTICEEIRKVSSVPVIMITARGEEYDKLRGFELGVDDYIVKPFSPKELMARIKAILKRSMKITNIINIDTLSLNIESKQLFIEGREVSLTPKEYELLELLIINEDKVFSRENILNKVWGYDFYGDERTVDTHVKQLREKLKEYKQYLKTVWGIGYKFSIGDENEKYKK